MFGETPVEGYEVHTGAHRNPVNTDKIAYVSYDRNLDLHAGEVVYVVELHVRNGNTLEEGHVYRYFVGHH